MTNYQNLPEELLLVIFNYLNGRDLLNCQYVCKLWYIPARVKYLNRGVSLRNITLTRRFITSINRNPNPRFLAAVKEIYIHDTKNLNLTDTVIYKLLFRFPNLERVEITQPIVNKLDDGLCRRLLHQCPKLAYLKVGLGGYLVDTHLRNVRLLVTDLDSHFDNIENPEQFVTTCPRLEVISSRNRFNTFEKMLPILANMPKLTTIRAERFENDTVHFMRIYLQTKTQDERSHLLERISKVTDLEIRCVTAISECDLEFIAEYMTGLERIKIQSPLSENNRQFQIYPSAVSLIQSIKHCRYMTRIPGEVVWDCLPTFVHQVFQRPTKEKVLQVEVVNATWPEVNVVAGEKTQICFRVSHHELENRTCLFESIPEIDTFSLTSPYFCKTGYMYVYEAFFNSKSTFKQVTLQVPETIVGGEQPINSDVAENHTSVEKLTIKSGRGTAIGPLLDRCSAAFRNLRLLTLDGFCGTWLEDATKYQLELARFSLEKLVINLLPLCQGLKDNEFIVIQVEVLSSGNIFLYKIPSGRSEATRINDLDLVDFEQGENYDLIHLIVGDLRYLKLVKKLVDRRDETLETKLDVELV